jgi:hypothetical protein
MITAQAIFDEAFPASRPPRSDAYREGVLCHLRYRMLESPAYTSSYAAGTAEADAFWSGVTEAWGLLEKHNADRRKA